VAPAGLRDEDQGGGVHAIKLAGGGRAVIEDHGRGATRFCCLPLPSVHPVAARHEPAGLHRDFIGAKEKLGQPVRESNSYRTEDRLEGGLRVIGAFLVEMVIFPGEAPRALFPRIKYWSGFRRVFHSDSVNFRG